MELNQILSSYSTFRSNYEQWIPDWIEKCADVLQVSEDKREDFKKIILHPSPDLNVNCDISLGQSESCLQNNYANLKKYLAKMEDPKYTGISPYIHAYVVLISISLYVQEKRQTGREEKILIKPDAQLSAMTVKSYDFLTALLVASEYVHKSVFLCYDFEESC